MKTILVIYSDYKVSTKEAVAMKKYAFNTNAPVKVGDRLDIEDYTTPVQVVEVLNRMYKYVDTGNGALGDKVRSTRSFAIREIKLRTETDNANVVYATREARR